MSSLIALAVAAGIADTGFRQLAGGLRSARLLFLLALGVAAGCASRTDLMNYHATPGVAFPAPAANQAVVVFVRSDVDATSAAVFDGDEFLGVLLGSTYIAHTATAGDHRFMVISEAADFMDATLEPGRVYFALVEPRFGVWRARFSLNPVSPLEPEWKDLPDLFRSVILVTPNAAGKSWAQENSPSIRQKHEAYLREWMMKKEKPKLYPQDGVPFSEIPVR